jgi:hypothetical protein
VDRNTANEGVHPVASDDAGGYADPGLDVVDLGRVWRMIWVRLRRFCAMEPSAIGRFTNRPYRGMQSGAVGSRTGPTNAPIDGTGGSRTPAAFAPNARGRAQTAAVHVPNGRGGS